MDSNAFELGRHLNQNPRKGIAWMLAVGLSTCLVVGIDTFCQNILRLICWWMKKRQSD